MSLEFVRKQKFKLKKIKRLIYVRNENGFFKKEGPIKYMVEVNIYYQEYRVKIEINVIEGQKQSVILEMLWLVYHNSEIDWRMGKVKITICLEECGKQWKPKQGKSEQQKQKREKRKKKRKPKKERMMELKKMVKEWKICDKKEEVTKSEKMKKLVLEKFHK